MHAAGQQVPRVTVVIPARNEAAAIRSCLESVQTQTEQSLQIIVVDGASTDETPDVVRSMAEDDPRIELLDNPDLTVPFAMNRALAAARAEILVRVDAHATIPPTYVEQSADLLESGTWGAVGGLKIGVGETRQGKAIAVAMASRFGVGGSTYHYGTEPQEVEHVPFGSYRTRLAREIGGWGEQFTVNQDFEFDFRLREAGHRILFDPRLKIDWECRQSLRALFRQYRRYGRGKVKVAAAHPSSLSPRHGLPPALVAYAAVVLVGSLGSGRGLRPAALALAPYAAVLAAGTAANWTSVDPPAARAYLLPSFAAMHVGWGIGFWEGVAEHLRQGRR